MPDLYIFPVLTFSVETETKTTSSYRYSQWPLVHNKVHYFLLAIACQAQLVLGVKGRRDTAKFTGHGHINIA